jgi:carbon-monoxide dehydrogenase large subunit
MVGGAVLDAARELRATLERASAGLMRVPEASVKFRNGGIDMVDVNGKGHRVDLKTVASKLPGLAGYGTFTSRVNPPTYGAYFAEVEVDTDTGQIRVVKVAAALDLGRAVNPAQCRGQIEGSVMMGVEMCLLGDLVHEDCLPLNASYFDYRLASTEDAPEIEAILVESAHEPSGPYGVKGIGTPAMTPIAPAICNAVSAALGVRVDTIPISPEWVLRVLGKLQP